MSDGTGQGFELLTNELKRYRAALDAVLAYFDDDVSPDPSQYPVRDMVAKTLGAAKPDTPSPQKEMRKEAAPTVEREQELVTLHGRSILIHHGLYSVQIVEGDDEDARFVADCAKSLLASYKFSVLQEVRKQVEDEYDPLDETMYGCGHRDGIRDVLALLDKMEGK